MQSAARIEPIQGGRSPGVLLVTGAPGWLTDRLLASLHSLAHGVERVRCLVHRNVKVDVAAWARSFGVEVEVVRGDLTDAESLRAAVRGVDSVLHAAGLIHVDRIKDYYDVNTEGTRCLTEAAAEAGARRFVYVSTNAAGGKSPSAEHVLTEDDPFKPLSHYGRSKWLGELAMFAVPTTMERVALRPCMFYGPPVPPRHVELFRRIVHGRMPLVGGGNYARSVTHVDHLVQASLRALTRPEAPGRTYYIADARVYTTGEIVKAMARALGVEPRWLRLTGIAASVAYQVDTWASRFDRYLQTVHLVGEANWHVGVSIDRARRELGYDPVHTLDDGMRSAVEWCRQRNLL